MSQVKPGDLAVIVGYELPCMSGDLGAIVEVIERDVEDLWVINSLSGPLDAYSYETGEFLGRDSEGLVIRERHLRPLLDTDGEDEVLRIAGLPKTDFTDTTFMPLEMSK